MNMADEYKQPNWQKDGNGNWYCSDDTQMAFAIGCRLKGFDLPGFDNWLNTILEWPLGKELLNRRARAEKAMLAKNHEVFTLLLEFMLDRKRDCTREDFLLPLARRGDKFNGKNKKKLNQALLEIISEVVGLIIEQKGKCSLADLDRWLGKNANGEQSPYRIEYHADGAKATVTWGDWNDRDKDGMPKSKTRSMASLDKYLAAIKTKKVPTK